MLDAAGAAATDSEYQFAATCLTIIIKFWGAITFFAVNLQSMETYPTCLRQTGISCGAIFSNGVGVLGPYIAYLVNIMHKRRIAFVSGVAFIFQQISFHPSILRSVYPSTVSSPPISSVDIGPVSCSQTSFSPLRPLLFDWKCFWRKPQRPTAKTFGPMDSFMNESDTMSVCRVLANDSILVCDSIKWKLYNFDANAANEIFWVRLEIMQRTLQSTQNQTIKHDHRWWWRRRRGWGGVWEVWRSHSVCSRQFIIGFCVFVSEIVLHPSTHNRTTITSSSPIVSVGRCGRQQFPRCLCQTKSFAWNSRVRSQRIYIIM